MLSEKHVAKNVQFVKKQNKNKPKQKPSVCEVRDDAWTLDKFQNAASFPFLAGRAMHTHLKQAVTLLYIPQLLEAVLCPY